MDRFWEEGKNINTEVRWEYRMRNWFLWLLGLFGLSWFVSVLSCGPLYHNWVISQILCFGFLFSRWGTGKELEELKLSELLRPMEKVVEPLQLSVPGNRWVMITHSITLSLSCCLALWPVFVIYLLESVLLYLVSRSLLGWPEIVVVFPV